MRILVVEDERSLADAIVRGLRRDGLAVDVAYDGTAGHEMAMVTRAMRGDYLAGPLSAADYALYTLLAFVWRSQIKLPDLDADSMLTPPLARWKARIEALPYFDKTIPPHWRKS